VRARDTKRGDRSGGIAGHESQRPAQRLQVELEPAIALAVPDEPGGEPVVARRSAAAQRLDGLVGLCR
jgi:hypothetical protein